ncbi:MAG: DUF3800 domain-containing protein [Acidobacteriia bacterium]|nr:DUF3800 domain-containing protein [Terriglobia bacterium]
MLKAFIDDSGSAGDSPWFVLAGYVGTVEGWDRFDPLWESVLSSPPSIDYFKSTEAVHLRGEFDEFTSEERDAKLDALIDVIGTCAERAVCARMRQRDYNEIAKGCIPARFDSPYYLLFPSIIAAAVNIERIEGEGQPAEFVFDTDQRFERLAYEMVPSLMPLRSFNNGIVNVSYRDDRDFLPLQAADLLAWQIRRGFSKPDEPKRRHFDSARLCPPREPHTFVFTRAQLVATMGELRERITEFCRVTGKTFDPKDL